MTEIFLKCYIDNMISEFYELSEKIDLLAEMMQALRGENGVLRRANAELKAANLSNLERMGEAQRRIEALLENIPSLVEAGLAEAAVHDQEKGA